MVRSDVPWHGALAGWYKRHLGIDDIAETVWSQQAGPTVFTALWDSEVGRFCRILDPEGSPIARCSRHRTRRPDSAIASQQADQSFMDGYDEHGKPRAHRQQGGSTGQGSLQKD